MCQARVGKRRGRIGVLKTIVELEVSKDKRTRGGSGALKGLAMR